MTGFRNLARITAATVAVFVASSSVGTSTPIGVDEACAQIGVMNTCCIQVIAACGAHKGYYDKGCSGPCGVPCVEPE